MTKKLRSIFLVVPLLTLSTAVLAADNTMEVMVDQVKKTKQTVACKEPIQRDDTTMTCDHVAQSFRIVMWVKEGSEPITIECVGGFGVFAYKDGFVKQCVIDKSIIVYGMDGNEMRCAGHIVFSGRGGVENCW
jgi:hypothetical protein